MKTNAKENPFGGQIITDSKPLIIFFAHIAHIQNLAQLQKHFWKL